MGPQIIVTLIDGKISKMVFKIQILFVKILSSLLKVKILILMIPRFLWLFLALAGLSLLALLSSGSAVTATVAVTRNCPQASRQPASH